METAMKKGSSGSTPRYQPLYVPPVPQDGAAEGRVILRDGTTATLKRASPADYDLLAPFLEGLSAQSFRQRFFSSGAAGLPVLQKLLDSSNPRRQLTLLVLRGSGSERRLIAMGSYTALDDPEAAEISLAVQDAFQGQGLGTLLLERLTLIAAVHGFRRFHALTHPDNRKMLDVFRQAGLELRETSRDGYVAVDLSLTPSRESVERMELRDRLLTAASLRPLFRPRSIAVIGASRDPGSIGYRILEGLVLNRFNGPVYPVNPNAHVIGSIPAYRSVADIPGPVDLAVIVVPAARVPEVVDACGRKGVRCLIVISAGFAEIGEEGRRRQLALVEQVRGWGMRMVGPNCLGVLNAHPEVRMNASFSPVFPNHGHVAMSSQSGALGLAVLAYAHDLGLGLSTFVSTGNKADISGNDLLQYWEEDEDTKVILLYLESFGNPRRFGRIARRVARRKPIVAVKGGRGTAGTRAAASHTAALAASDTAVEALFRQTGVIRVDTLDEMFDTAAALAHQPLPRGGRVAIMTNAGGPGILCSDACEAAGLVVPELAEETRRQLAAFLPREASLANPVDMIASASPDDYRRTLAALLAAPEVDAVIVIYIPVGLAETDAIAAAIRDGLAEGRRRGGAGKPVYGCLMTERKLHRGALDFGTETVPCYRFPESAARALGRVAGYAAWRQSPPGMIPAFPDLDVERARRVCRAAVAHRGEGWLDASEVRQVLEAFNLPLVPTAFARSPEEAVAAARRIGYPVVVKLASKTIVHKTEFGGVRLNITSDQAVEAAFNGVRAALAERGRLDEMDGVVIQPLVKGGVEVMVGVTHDPTFGPLVAFGLGGIHVEVLRDVCFRVSPLTDEDARHMITSIRGYRLLEGYRGHPPADVKAIEELVLRVSRLAEEIPEVVELDMNPVLALPPGEGCRIVDARIRVAADERPGTLVTA